jgi:PAS domain S-box-containing protein
MYWEVIEAAFMQHWLGMQFFESHRPRTIRFRLLWLVALILLPLAGLAAWLSFKLAATERELIELNRAAVTRQLSQRADWQISRQIGVLLTLGNSQDRRGGNFDDLEQSQAALKSNFNIVRIWAFVKDGPVPGESARVIQEPEPDFYTSVLAGKSAVSVMRGEGSTAVFTIGVPIETDGRTVYGLAADIHANYLSHDLFKNSGMGQDWVAAIVDRNNHFVARSLDPERRVGQLARPELGLAAGGQKQSGVFENITLEGAVVLNAFYRSTLTAWTTVVAVPKAVIRAPLNRSIAFLTLGGIALLLITTAIATIQAQRISEPVRKLSDFAAALSEGRPYNQLDHHITELDDVRLALEKTMTKSAHLGALVASSGDAILSMGITGQILTWNSGAEKLLGYTAEEIIGKSKTMIIPKDRVAEFREEFEQVLGGNSVRLETVRLRRDGSLVDVSITSAPIHKPDGEIAAISSIIRDISDRKAAEAHVEILMRELAHRSKNQIAVIQSIANRTARTADSLADFSNVFGQRLRALADSYDLLIEQNWKSVKLADLIAKQLAIFVHPDSFNLIFHTDGPDVDLPAASTEAIGLALHELATNSVKYGAWSRPSGKVTVTWEVETDAEGTKHLDLGWVEFGGPVVAAAPDRRGFGSFVIEAMVSTTLGGSANIQFAPAGIKWHLRCPLTE